MGTVVLRAGREKSLRRRHPWVFSGAIERVEGHPQTGETVTVVDADRQFLARAAFSPISQIRARVWTFDPDEVVDEAFVGHRVRASVERRAALTRRTDAMRLIYAESDGLPGVIADRYGPWVILELTSAGAERWRDVLVAALAEVPGVRGVYERSDLEVRDREGLEQRVGVAAGEEPASLIEIVEDGRPHLVDVRSGHKTGYYLDQRDNRALVADAGHTDGCSTASATPAASPSPRSPRGEGGREHRFVRSRPRPGRPQPRPQRLRRRPGWSRPTPSPNCARRRRAGEHFDVIVVDPPKLANSPRTEQLNRSTRAPTRTSTCRRSTCWPREARCSPSRAAGRSATTCSRRSSPAWRWMPGGRPVWWGG